MSGQSFRKTKITFSPHTIIKNKLQINDLNEMFKKKTWVNSALLTLV